MPRNWCWPHSLHRHQPGLQCLHGVRRSCRRPPHHSGERGRLQVNISALSLQRLDSLFDCVSHAACKSMLGCIYGGTFDTSYDHPMLRHMREEVFAYRALAAGLKLPKIHLVINNRVTIYNLRSVQLLRK